MTAQDEDDDTDDVPGGFADPVPAGPGVPPAKPVVHVMRGLPASGKSTLARQMMAAAGGRMRRVSLDELRRMMDDNDGSKRLGRRHEETVLAVQDAAVLAAVEAGFDVVVDNTHLVSRIPKRLKNLLGGRADLRGARPDRRRRRGVRPARRAAPEPGGGGAHPGHGAAAGLDEGLRLEADRGRPERRRTGADLRRGPGAAGGGAVRHRRHAGRQHQPRAVRLGEGGDRRADRRRPPTPWWRSPRAGTASS